MGLPKIYNPYVKPMSDAVEGRDVDSTWQPTTRPFDLP